MFSIFCDKLVIQYYIKRLVVVHISCISIYMQLKTSGAYLKYKKPRLSHVNPNTKSCKQNYYKTKPRTWMNEDLQTPGFVCGY